jgi:hypothetical protein
MGTGPSNVSLVLIDYVASGTVEVGDRALPLGSFPFGRWFLFASTRVFFTVCTLSFFDVSALVPVALSIAISCPVYIQFLSLYPI